MPVRKRDDHRTEFRAFWRARWRPLCGVWRSLAVFCDRSLTLVADDEDARGGFDDVVRDGVELVDFEYPVDLGEETF